MSGVLSRRTALVAGLAVLTLSACGTPPPEEPNFRNQEVAIGGTTRFDPALFDGEWFVVARMPDASAAPRKFTYERLIDQMREAGDGPVRRYRVREGSVLQQVPTSLDDRLVVMWVDDDFRTAAVGTIDGKRGTIFDRSPEGSEDRIRAATEVMEFYGWDVGRLIRVAP
ncbi:hypothetical protein R5H30_01440 [Sulfitobacter sp. D35]|uniref:lipocalin family protein n=1 Tax=Sulfitobacter sp. D35 TaxID=3083252 RepID=UPI00296FFE05|nr:lipocalin family protein [Sulfitobacter sp. D35]MDW4496629.1 hypothetical protein [Sulfitobacter sp. D35]